MRFTTSHPRDFTKDIIDAIDAVPTLCDHVHLPVQSGSSRVLQSMFREYTREQYLERIGWMKAARNREISITTDIIVGFPGETEEEFRETLGSADRGRLRRRVLVQVLASARTRRRCSTPTRSPTPRSRGACRSCRSISGKFSGQATAGTWAAS